MGSYQVTFQSQQPLPSDITVPELQKRQAVGSLKAAGLDGSTPNLVVPLTATPDGFTLQHPGYRRSDYIYDSDDVYQGSTTCANGTCHVDAQVKVQFHEVVQGGSSHTWALTMSMSGYSNASNLTWSYFATYYCGVNVTNASDTECNNGAAPSSANMSVNTLVYKPWGATNSITTFPMVAARTQFSNGNSVVTRFRGRDTLSRSATTRLAASSGDGS